MEKMPSILTPRRGRSLLFAGLLPILLVAACRQLPVPKPEGYPRIDFPPKSYRLLDTALPYTFEIPIYASLRMRADSMGHDIVVPHHKASIHLSYFSRPVAVDTLIEDARTLAYKHSIKADAIEERWYEHPERRVFAMLYRIEGDVASSVQFYATDSMYHFLRGALYFYCPPNADSLAPAIDFYAQDIIHMLETLQWK